MKKTLLTITYIMITASINAQSFQWARKLGGIRQENATSIVIDNSGNVYSTGYFIGPSDFDPGIGTFNLKSVGPYDLNDVFVSKINAAGEFIWAKSMGGISTDDGNALAVDLLGNVYVAGSFFLTADFDPGSDTFNLKTLGVYDAFICKLDAAGNFVWAKSMGGTQGKTEILSMVIDKSGNIYTTGYFEGTVDFDPNAGVYSMTSDFDIGTFICKLNASGDFVWAKGVGLNAFSQGRSIALDDSGSIYTTGHFGSVLYDTIDFDPGPGTFNLKSKGNDDIFILKLNTLGDLVWAKSVGGSSNERANSIVVDDKENVYYTGSFSDKVDFDPGLDTFNITCTGNVDIFISKLNSNGDFVWGKSFAGTRPSIGAGNSVTIDRSGNLYTTGNFRDIIDFDPGPDTCNSATPGGIFISKLDSSGNFVWAKNMGETYAITSGNSIAMDEFENIYTAGCFYGNFDFDPGVGIFNLASNGDNDIFIHKMSNEPIGIEELESEDNVMIYPNPTARFFSVIFSKPVTADIEIYNSLGAVVYKRKNLTDMNNIELTKQPSGLYFVKIISNNKIVTTKKIIKQ